MPWNRFARIAGPLSLTAALAACSVASTPPPTIVRAGDCVLPSGPLVGAKIDVEVARVLDAVEGFGIIWEPKLLRDNTEWARNAEAVEYAVCRAAQRGGSTQAQLDWLRAMLLVAAQGGDLSQWLKDNQRPMGPTSAAPTIPSLAGKYALKETARPADDFFRALSRDELFIGALPGQVHAGTYVRLTIWPPVEVWMRDERTGREELRSKSKTTDYTEERGRVHLDGQTLTFEQQQYTGLDGKVDRRHLRYVRELAVSPHDPRLMMLAGDEVIETWERLQ